MKGKVIQGRYRLERLLGEGGMGQVWLATHLGLDAPVALKLIQARGKSPERVVERFLREARVAAAVRHRNVVAIKDVGAAEDGQPYMVMELLEGASLAERLERGPPMPVAELIDIVAQTLSGLAAVHDAGIVHRDLKPENIFLVQDADGPYPKLLDFGVSRAIPGSGSGGRKGAMSTSDGSLVGTPHYMSPEQARGLNDVDRRTDIYATGVILYEALAGCLPYDSPHIGDLIISIARGGAQPLSAHRDDLGTISDVVAKAMAHDREGRYANAREMRTALLQAAVASLAGFSARVASADITGSFGVPPRARESMETLDPQPERGKHISGRVSAPPVETDRETRIKTHPSLHPGPRRSTWVTAAIAAGGLAVVGLGSWAVIHATGPDAQTPTHGPTATPAPTPSPTRAAALPSTPTPPAIATVHTGPVMARIALHELPQGATVLVDGATAPLVDGAVMLARDGQVHTIEVRAPGMLPWRVAQPAVADADLSVQLLAARDSTHHHHHDDATHAGDTQAPTGTGGGLARDPGF